MSAYIAYVRDQISDPDEFKEYQKRSASAGAGHSITPLALYGLTETLEGPEVDGAVILRIRTSLNDPMYLEALTHRL